MTPWLAGLVACTVAATVAYGIARLVAWYARRLTKDLNHHRGIPMTTADNRRRAVRLMKDAREQAVALRNHGGYTALERAARQTVFVEEAARLWPKAYSNAEARRVLTMAVDALARYGGAR